MPFVALSKKDFSERERRNIEILDILRRCGPISRPEISKQLGINIVTTSSYIDNFLKHNLVLEKERDISEGGRRPALLDINPKAGYIIGVGLNLMNMVGVLIDLKGNIIFKTQKECQDVSVREVAVTLLDIIRQILRRAKDYPVKGIGVGIAGIVDKEDGTVRWPERIKPYQTNYVSINVRLKEIIKNEFGLDPLIENDATSACFGEYWLNLTTDIKNVLFMFSGVGIGMVLNGELYTGSRGCAGEPSIYNYKEDKVFNCALGNPCFLKRWELDLGIVEGVKERLNKDKTIRDKFLNLISLRDINYLTLRDIFQATKLKEEVSCAVLQEAAKRLGIKIAYLVDLFNPEIVIVGGGLEEAGEEFLNQLTSTVKEWAFREATEDLKIIYSQLRENAVALGAASLVMQRLFAYFC